MSARNTKGLLPTAKQEETIASVGGQRVRSLKFSGRDYLYCKPEGRLRKATTAVNLSSRALRFLV